MNKDIKKKWIEELKSGKYKQGSRKLRRTVNFQEEFCCLGVLCDIYSKENGIAWNLNQDWRPCYYIHNEFSHLPKEVIKWSELNEYDHEIYIKEKNIHLTTMNDSGSSFEDIASIIEEFL